MAELEEDIIKEFKYKLYLWWRYIDDIFSLWEHDENKLKSLIDKINKVHSTIKIYSRNFNFYHNTSKLGKTLS